jgi:putative permease
LGLNYGLLLAIGVGLSVIIPYVGMIIITIPIVIIGLIQFGLSGDMVWLIAIYTIIQILDGYVLTPMLFSETLNLDPFSILVAIVVFGGLLGFWGVVLAIPLATFVKTIFTKWPVNRKYIENKKLEAKSIS